MTTTAYVKPVQGGEWTELKGVTFDEPSLHVQAGRLLEAVHHEPPASDAPRPLSAWQRAKLQRAMQRDALRAKWGLR